MIQEDYVSVEIAELLKEKGFNEIPVYTYYLSYGGFYLAPMAVTNKDLYAQGHIAAPTLQMAMKWLREKYNYHIITTPEYGDVEYMPGQWQEEFLGWKYTIIPFNGNKSIIHPSVYSVTSESACEAAIKYCLENLI